MRKVYVPVYLIEWSDVRPYAIMAGRGLRQACIYAGIGLRYLGIGLCLAAIYLWKGLCAGFRFLCKGTKWLCINIWEIVLGVFTASTPQSSSDDDDDDDDDESDGGFIKNGHTLFEEVPQKTPAE